MSLLDDTDYWTLTHVNILPLLRPIQSLRNHPTLAQQASRMAQ